MKIIGVELNIRTHSPVFGTRQFEAAMFECGVVLPPADPRGGMYGPPPLAIVTIHTTAGDRNAQVELAYPVGYNDPVWDSILGVHQAAEIRRLHGLRP